MKVKKIRTVHPGGCRHREVTLDDGRKYIFHDVDLWNQFDAEQDFEMKVMLKWIGDSNVEDYAQLEGVTVGGKPKRAPTGSTLIIGAGAGI